MVWTILQNEGRTRRKEKYEHKKNIYICPTCLLFKASPEVGDYGSRSPNSYKGSASFQLFLNAETIQIDLNSQFDNACRCPSRRAQLTTSSDFEQRLLNELEVGSLCKRPAQYYAKPYFVIRIVQAFFAEAYFWTPTSVNLPAQSLGWYKN